MEKGEIGFEVIRGRDAYGSIGGYFYQSLLTVLRWINLGPAETLHLEKAEDLDKSSDNSDIRTNTQVKSSVEPISLNDIRETFANAVFHQEMNPSIEVKTEYFTPAPIRMEKKKPFYPKPGIQAWNELGEAEDASEAKVNLDKLRTYLLGCSQPDGLNATIWTGYIEFIKRSTDEQLFRFVKSFAIRTGESDLEGIEAQIDEALQKREFAAKELSSDARMRLHYHVIHLLSMPGEKQLVASDLGQVVQRTLSDDERTRYGSWQNEASEIRSAIGRVEIVADAIHEVVKDVDRRLAALRADDDPSPEDVFGANPSDAFDIAAESAVGNFKRDRYAGRPELERVLDEFYASSQSLFVLVGESGEGKTLAACAEATLRQQARPRAYMSAGSLLRASSLREAIAQSLKKVSKAGKTAEQICRAALSVARQSDLPFVLIADNVIGDLRGAEFAEKLATIAHEAEQDGIKVVITSRYSTWRQISSHVGSEENLFLLARGPGGGSEQKRSQFTGAETGEQFSYQLGPLTDEELKEILDKRFGNDFGKSLSAVLLTPAFASLRNAALLDIYCQQIEKNGWSQSDVKPAVTDGLLSTAANSAIERALSNLSILTSRQDEVSAALTEVMWEDRHQGVLPSALGNYLGGVIPNKGDELVLELQREGLLTETGTERLDSSDRITFAQPRVGERLLAQRLAQLPEWSTLGQAELVPGWDDGIVTALVRGPLRERGDNVFCFAEDSIREDKSWVPALCEGLGQLPEEDARVAAFLGAIANHRGEAWLQDALGPLGRRAYYCAPTRCWIGSRFLDSNSHEVFLAGIALSHALSLNPDWAIPLIQRCLELAAKNVGQFGTDRERRATKIALALSPLKWISNRRTAVLARGILEWLQSTHPLPELDNKQAVTERYDEEFEQAWAMVFRYADQAGLAELINTLASRNVFKRASAALALFVIAVDEPDYPGLRDAVVNALSVERYAVVPMLHLAYVYAANGDLGIADAIDESRLVEDWRASLALTELGLLAKRDSERVAAILPRSTSVYENSRAPLVEPLAVAWTRVGINGQRDDAQEILEPLSSPDLDVPVEQFLFFAHRGAAVATLGLIILDIPACHPDFERVNSLNHHLSGDTNYGYRLLRLCSPASGVWTSSRTSRFGRRIP